MLLVSSAKGPRLDVDVVVVAAAVHTRTSPQEEHHLREQIDCSKLEGKRGQRLVRRHLQKAPGCLHLKLQSQWPSWRQNSCEWGSCYKR